MIGSARPVGRAVKCEDDDTDRSAGRTEELIVRANYPISVIEQVLCVLQARLPRCRVDIDRHPPAGGRPDELRGPRSEEHTSELQSQSNLVCRLLLEKKNNGGTCRLHLIPAAILFTECL